MNDLAQIRPCHRDRRPPLRARRRTDAAGEQGPSYRRAAARALPPSAIDPFRQGLREFGWIEGQSIILEYGLAQSVAQLPDVAANLIRLKVDVLVASGTASVLPARDVTGTIPVVFVAAIDPVSTGVVASLARPGGHVTGVSADQAALTGKRMELSKELLPNLSRIALLVRDPSPNTAKYVREAELAARTLGTRLQILTVRDPSDFEVRGSIHRRTGRERTGPSV